MNEKIFIKQILTIKEYKLTLNSFLEEEKLDRPKKKCRYFVDLILTAIQTHDLDTLLKIWKEYEILYFKFLDSDKQKAADIMKSDIYKAFLVECSKNKKIDKISSFFQTMGYMLINKSEWIDWFEFPFTKLPADHKVFAIYFTRVWFDNFSLSLFNFFMQIVRCVMSNENDLEKFFSVGMKLDNIINQLEKNEIEKIRQKFNLPHFSMDRNQLRDLILCNVNYTPRYLHDVIDLICDFRLIRENKKLEYRKFSKSSKSKGISNIIQNKAKNTSSTFNRKKGVPNIHVDSVNLRENIDRTDDQSSESNINYAQVQVSDDSNLVVGGVSINLTHYVSPDKSATAGIKNLSSKISQKIFKSKLNVINEIQKPLIHHEHFSMVTHVKFSRALAPYWASLDVGGTFKIWSINETSPKSLHTLSLKHTIFSFDWLSDTSNLILLGTKGGSIKLFNIQNNEIIREMDLDSTYPRINIVQSFDDSKFVCASLDRSRKTSCTSFPHGILSLHDNENWTTIRKNLIDFNADFIVNSVHCTSNTIISGCSDGSVRLVDIRVQSGEACEIMPVFTGEEIINVTGICQSKWPKSTLDSNYILCLSSKSNLKMFDIRQTVKPLNKEFVSLSDLTMPLTWTERPCGGEQTINFPRSNLICNAFLNTNWLFSAAKKGIMMQQIGGTLNVAEPTFLNVGHNSPVICIDSSPCDLNNSGNAVIISGTIEGTISTIKVIN